jgi:spore germination protein GerM
VVSRVVVVAAVLVAVAVVGCGSSPSPSGAGASARAPAAPRDQSFGTTIYFLTEDGTAPLGVRRMLSRRDGAALAALRALVAGPSDAERSSGLRTALPARVEIRSLRIQQRAHSSDAFVDLAGLPSTADAVQRVRVVTQVTRTLVGLSDVGRVWIRAGGHPWGLWSMRGGALDAPHDYAELLGFTDVCTSARGTETVPAECFTALP